MTNHQFMRGMGMGLAAGAVLGVALATKEKAVRHTADKAMRAVNDAASHISDTMGR